MDLIDRDMLIEELNKRDDVCYQASIQEVIDSLPSKNIEWYPPEECELNTVLVTVLIHGKLGVMVDVVEAEVSHEWATGNALYYKDGIQLTPLKGYRAVAWAPLPEPHEVSRDEISEFRREIANGKG